MTIPGDQTVGYGFEAVDGGCRLEFVAGFHVGGCLVWFLVRRRGDRPWGK